MSAVVVDLAGDLEWNAFEIPDSNVPVRLSTLNVEPTRARTVLVRFPAGWERPGMGWYTCAEEMVMLEGTLEMNGKTFVAGDWGYVPAGLVRVASVARTEVLVVARFDGPARWTSGYPGEGKPNGRQPLRRPLAPTAGAVDSPFGAGRAWRLRRGSIDNTWLLDAPPHDAPAPCEAELLALDARTWALVPAGETTPRLEGLCFCRTVEASADEEEP